MTPELFLGRGSMGSIRSRSYKSWCLLRFVDTIIQPKLHITNFFLWLHLPLKHMLRVLCNEKGGICKGTGIVLSQGAILPHHLSTPPPPNSSPPPVFIVRLTLVYLRSASVCKGSALVCKGLGLGLVFSKTENLLFKWLECKSYFIDLISWYYLGNTSMPSTFVSRKKSKHCREFTKILSLHSF